MNDRIRELAELAGKRGSPDHPLYWTNGINDTLEKFAELIVKECMDVAKYHTPETEECEHTWLIHDKIKQHFGVEE